MFKLTVVVLSISAISFADNCRPSITTASGWAAPEKICAGSLIFKENFDHLDRNIWQGEVTLGGGGGVSVISSIDGCLLIFLFVW